MFSKINAMKRIYTEISDVLKNAFLNNKLGLLFIFFNCFN